MPAHSHTPRKAAFLVLKEIFAHRHPLDFGYNKHLSTFSAQEAAWIKALCFGFLKKKYEIDFILEHCLKHPPHPQRDLSLSLTLGIGVYQILYMTTPLHAALFETVELAKSERLPPALINAILRRVEREKESLQSLIPESLTFNHPAWLLSLICEQYPKEWRDIVTQNNAHPPFFLRVNRLKTTPEEYQSLLQIQGIEAHCCSEAPDALLLPHPIPVSALPFFDDGYVSVQDISAQQAPFLLDLKPALSVLDACAAPGGKACHMLEHAHIHLTCLDHKKKRLESIEQNLFRLGLKATLEVANSLEVEYPLESFDRILLDAPCSGSGVLRRHPDIRFLKHPEDIPTLADTQYRLLAHLFPFLKKGGSLLYATCSILKEENDEVIARFLQKEPTAETCPLFLTGGIATSFGHQFLPRTDSYDGFYYAKIIKQGSP